MLIKYTGNVWLQTKITAKIKRTVLYLCSWDVNAYYLFDDRTPYYTSSTKQPLTTVRRSLRLEKTLFFLKLKIEKCAET